MKKILTTKNYTPNINFLLTRVTLKGHRLDITGVLCTWSSVSKMQIVYQGVIVQASLGGEFILPWTLQLEDGFKIT